eukprot:1162054-Pelagomonas_calceolata.AAC.1
MADVTIRWWAPTAYCSIAAAAAAASGVAIQLCGIPPLDENVIKILGDTARWGGRLLNLIGWLLHYHAHDGANTWIAAYVSGNSGQVELICGRLTAWLEANQTTSNAKPKS